MDEQTVGPEATISPEWALSDHLAISTKRALLAIIALDVGDRLVGLRSRSKFRCNCPFRCRLPTVISADTATTRPPCAGLAIAQATGADFVRIKVFVGGKMTAQGPRHGIGA
jgi:hypothetical protein